MSTDIASADFQTTPLHNGTVGDVQLITGKAYTADGMGMPYKVVMKVQKKWERYNDPASWRREYDLYKSNLGTMFTESFRWPVCYHLEMNAAEDEMQLWMEYIEGVSGLNLSGEAYERAAKELGSFQGKLYAEQPAFLNDLTNLNSAEYMKSFYLHYRSWDKVYDYIRSDHCEIPRHLCRMLIDIDEDTDGVFRRIEQLPVVLCHKDFWVANILDSKGATIIIDWDTAGWGRLGEDLASLLADEADNEHMVEYYHRCIPAYYKGFSEYCDISHVTDDCVYEMMLLLFGYRLIEWHINAEPGDRTHIQTLQNIYEMKNGEARA